MKGTCFMDFVEKMKKLFGTEDLGARKNEVWCMLTGEFVGTLFLVLFGCASCVSGFHSPADIVQIALAFGLTIATMAQVLPSIIQLTIIRSWSILNPPIRINRPGFDCLGLFVRDPQSLPSSLFNPRWFESMRSGDVSGFWRDLVSFVHPLIPSPPLPLRVDSSCLLIDFLGVVWFIPSPRSEWEYFRLIRLRVVTGSSKGAGHATASSFLYLKLTNRSSSLNQLIKTD